MLQWWTVNNYKQTQKIEFANKEICQQILENNIFGVDVNTIATLISIFSLTIALLDKLEPKEIWNDLKFNNLRDNITTQSFFDWATKNKDTQFELVVGNPPFNPMSNVSRKDAVSEAQIQQFGISSKDIPNNNFALKFFEGAMFFGKKSCLIIPSNVLLYNKAKSAHKYRNRIFTKFTIEKIFDFTHLRRELFGSVDTPVCAVLGNSIESQQQTIEHIVIKRVTSTEKKLYFEIDHYDYHYVRHDWAIDASKQFIWKTNLLGGGRLFHLIYRLSLLKNLDTFIKNKVEQNKWVYSIGYIIKHSKKKKFQAKFITGKATIKPKSFKYNGTFEKEIEQSELFVETRKEELYQSPHIIFKLVLEKETSKIPMIFSDEYLCFNSSFVGVHAPKEDKKELYKIYDRLYRNEETSKLYQTFILATSSKAIVYHETSIVKEDIDNLPYPDETSYLTSSHIEKNLIDDVLNYYRHLGKSITGKGQGKKLHEKVNQKQLADFGNIFCKIINSMHAEDNMCWQIGSVYETSEKTFIIYQFIFGLEKEKRSFKMQKLPINEIDIQLNNIIFNDKENISAIFTRITRIYGSQDDYDYLILIKPTTMRYWLNSIAARHGEASRSRVDPR